MKVTLSGKKMLLGLVGMVLIALLVAWSGLVPIAASSGHLPPVGWFLHWTMGNSVRTQSLLVQKPSDINLADPVLIRRGAGHFVTGCAPCHGGPTQVRNPVARSMTPAPPSLSDAARHWRERELFWIVRHGVKYTGMPAWPSAARNDEVWAMVAFLKALPGLDESAYLRLGWGRPESGRQQKDQRDEHQTGRSDPLPPEATDRPGRPETVPSSQDLAMALRDCTRCHGSERADGMADASAAEITTKTPAAPLLAGQSSHYLFASLRAFAEGRRASGVMQAVAARYDEATLRRLADHYAELSPAAVGAAAEPADASLDFRWRRGREIATVGIPELGVPPCASCHGAVDGEGRPYGHRVEGGDYYPRLAGQPRWYLRRQLLLFRAGTRGGTPFHPVMTFIARNLEPEAVAAVSAYYGGAIDGGAIDDEVSAARYEKAPARPD